MRLLRQLVQDDRGQDLIEYALLTGFVTLIVIVTARNIGETVNTIYDGVGTSVDQIPTS